MSVDVSQETNLINTAINGKDVRGSLANGITKIADELNSFEGNIDNRQTSVETRQANLESTFSQEIENAVSENPSSAETVGARTDNVNNVTYGTLGARLDNQASQMAESANKPILKNGKIKLPSTFPTIPFSISKVAKRKFTHNANPYNVFDWSDATEIFIAHEGIGTGSHTGTSYDNPITLERFKQNYENAVYGTTKKFILTILSNVYTNGTGLSFSNLDIDLYVRSGSLNGFTWLSRVKRPGIETSAWISDSGVYKSTIDVPAHVILDAINYIDLDDFGMPRPYTKVSSLAICQATNGTFYQLNGDVWCNPFNTHDIEDITLLVSTGLFRFTVATGKTLVLENIGFVANSYSLIGSDITSKLYIFNCKFYRGLNDAFSITGKYSAYLFDCVAVYGSKDGFNYHTTDANSVAVEINGISYGNGLYKIEGGNTTKHSNNGSTAHDGMRILRVGGKYWDCEGPVVADVMDCYSISIGCEVGNILLTSTGVSAGYYLDNAGVATPVNNKYVIDCFANGSNIDYGISGTDETYYMNFEGSNIFNGNIMQIDWEGII